MKATIWSWLATPIIVACHIIGYIAGVAYIAFLVGWYLGKSDMGTIVCRPARYEEQRKIGFASRWVGRE